MLAVEHANFSPSVDDSDAGTGERSATTHMPKLGPEQRPEMDWNAALARWAKMKKYRTQSGGRMADGVMP
jgi:hypothetical protein